jgi:hypothetical protein
MTPEQFKALSDQLTAMTVYQFTQLLMLGVILIFCALIAGHTKP